MDRVAHSRTGVALITDRAAATESAQRGEKQVGLAPILHQIIVE